MKNMRSMHAINITIADILIRLKSPLSAAELGIEKRLGPFFGEPDNPAAGVVLDWKESAEAPSARGTLIYDPGEIWKMYRQGRNFLAELRYPDENGIIGSPQGVLKTNTTWDKSTLTERRIGPERQSLLLNGGAGELLLRTRILFADGLVFHASGLDDNGRGIVFAGHAGAGKSTQLGLWTDEKGVIPMNDDRIAVRVSATGAFCYGTPWGGTANIARNHQAPLSAIVLLEQAPENKILQLAPAAAAPRLLARAFMPYWDKALMQRAFDNLNKILASVPVFHLRCRPEPAVVALVRSVL